MLLPRLPVISWSSFRISSAIASASLSCICSFPRLPKAVRIKLLCSCASAVMLPSPVHPESTGSRLICVPPAQRKLQAKPSGGGRGEMGGRIRMRTETKQLKGASSMPTLPAEDLSSCSGSVWFCHVRCLVGPLDFVAQGHVAFHLSDSHKTWTTE